MPSDTQIERELDAIDAALEGRAVDPDLTELAQLARALRDDRMEIDPFFARELDAKAAAGFPREARWRRLFTATPMLVPGVAASMLLALVVGISLLSQNGDRTTPSGAGTSSGGGAPAIAPGSAELSPDPPVTDQAQPSFSREKSAKRALKPQTAPGGGASGGGTVSSGAGSDSSSGTVSPAIGTPPVPGGGSVRSDPKQARKQETSASLTLATRPDHVQDVSDSIGNVAATHGGFVVTSSTQVAPDGGGASFVLRIPSEQLKSTVADLSGLADVRERRQATQDITAQFVSARSRLTDARAERAGLLRQLAKATTDADRARVKAQLRRVSARIAAAKTDLARVNNRASFSTIGVSVVGDPSAGASTGGDGGSWTPGDAARDAVRVLEVAAGIALIALAIGVPLAILAALALLLARLTQRRRRERLLDAI